MSQALGILGGIGGALAVSYYISGGSVEKVKEMIEQQKLAIGGLGKGSITSGQTTIRNITERIIERGGTSEFIKIIETGVDKAEIPSGGSLEEAFRNLFGRPPTEEEMRNLLQMGDGGFDIPDWLTGRGQVTGEEPSEEIKKILAGERPPTIGETLETGGRELMQTLPRLTTEKWEQANLLEKAGLAVGIPSAEFFGGIGYGMGKVAQIGEAFAIRLPENIDKGLRNLDLFGWKPFA